MCFFFYLYHAHALRGYAEVLVLLLCAAAQENVENDVFFYCFFYHAHTLRGDVR